MADVSDTELLEQWRSGHVMAGDQLFTRHFPAIHRFFRNKVAPGVIEDLVQQTFMRCTEGKERFRQDSTFKTFLFGVAHNLLREHYRHLRKEPAALDFSRSTAADLAAGPSTLFGKRREERLLLEGLRRIPLESQIVLELYYWEEMSASQTALVLGLVEPTVRGRVRRARALLREQIGKLADSPEELRTTLHGLDQWAAGLRDRLGRSDDPHD